MRTLRILGVAALGLLVMAQDATAQRRGAVSGGMRGAVVGGMVGGSERRGDRGQDWSRDWRDQGRHRPGNANAGPVPVHPGLSECPARQLQRSTAGRPWRRPGRYGDQAQRRERHSQERQAYRGDHVSRGLEAARPPTTISLPSVGMAKPTRCSSASRGIADKQAGIKQVKSGLENYLKDIKCDEPTETKGGDLLITGTGKGKKAGVDVVFAAGVLDAGNGQLVAVAFVVDAKIEDHYKETVRGICETLRRGNDFNKN